MRPLGIHCNPKRGVSHTKNGSLNCKATNSRAAKSTYRAETPVVAMISRFISPKRHLFAHLAQHEANNSATVTPSACCDGDAALSRAPKIDLSPDSACSVVSADLPPDLARQLSQRPRIPQTPALFLRLVRPNEKTGTEGPPIFGSYSLGGDTLQFVPQFPLSGWRALSRGDVPPGQKPERTDYSLPAVALTDVLPHVVKVYPSSETVPANLLKFYIYFSEPVRQSNQIFDQLHILDENGKTVYDPWRRFQQWSDDGKRLTLWIHPGRVKQGVNLREDFGAVLQPGHKYTLVIDAEVTDLAGRPMSCASKNTFAAAAEDHERLSLDKWDVKSPKAGTREPLLVTFPRPLDYALMKRLIAVRGRTLGEPVDGLRRTRRWRKIVFVPSRPALVGGCAHGQCLHELLEDLAGNTPVRVFDTDMQHPDTRPGVMSIRFIPEVILLRVPSCLQPKSAMNAKTLAGCLRGNPI